MNSVHSSGLPQHVVDLMYAGSYFGRNGAIHALETFFKEQGIDPWSCDELSHTMAAINVYYSAMTHAAKGSVFMKVRVPFLVYKVAHLADMVLGSFAKRTISSGDLHILMSAYARELEFFERLRVHESAKKIRELRLCELLKDLECRTLSNRHATNEKKEGDLLAYRMAQGLMCELHRKNILAYSYYEDALEDVRFFCGIYAEEVRMFQYISRLYRYLGDGEKEMEFAQKSGIKDQIMKAS